MCDCDCEPPEFFNSKWVNVGRKDYKCCECRTTIPKGEKHFTAAGKWDGDFETFRRCARCQRVCEAIEKAGHCVCFNGLFDGHAAYRYEFIDDATDDWLSDLERHYLKPEGATP